MNDGTKAERVYTPGEVATTLRVSQATISRAIRSGRLKAFRVGGQWRILSSELGRFINAETEAAIAGR
jgi:excisionase family DNA binding protein